MHLLSIIVPVYNEAGNISRFHQELLEHIPQNHEIIWIDDGSTDATILAIDDIAGRDSRVKCISLSKNFGHQNAILAGLHHAQGDYIIIMDGDLQHPPSLIPAMISKLQEGYDIVNTKRISTDNISVTKKVSSRLYYVLLNSLSDTSIPENGSDFKAFNKKVHSAVLKFEEREPFLRGIFSWVGFRSATLEFTATARNHGKSKYSFQKMLRLGVSGITSFSTKPLRIAFLSGLVITMLAFLFLIYAVYSHFTGNTMPGWTSIIGTIVFLGGVQLSFIGLIGIYVGRIIKETKKRPSYLINKKINL